MNYYAELCKNIPAKFLESLSNSSATHPKITLWSNISDSHSQNLAGIFLHICEFVTKVGGGYNSPAPRMKISKII